MKERSMRPLAVSSCIISPVGLYASWPTRQQKQIGPPSGVCKCKLMKARSLARFSRVKKAQSTKSKIHAKNKETKVMAKSIHKRKVLFPPKYMRASQKHNFQLLLFIKEFKNMGKDLKYSAYKLSLFQL